MDMYIKKKCFIVIAFLIVLLYICFFSIFSVKGKTIDLHKIISIHNNSLNLDYEKQIATIDNSIVSSYSDFNKNEYIFKNDKIIGYIQNKKVNEKSVDIKENNQYTMKDIKKLPLLSNIDFDGYVLGDVSYINSYNETVYTYYKYLNNIKLYYIQ